MANLSSTRNEFPELKQKVNGRNLIYLDNAATTLLPESIIEATADFDSLWKANVHRGAHAIADKATIYYEDARQKVASFIHAAFTEEIIFTRNTTESINLVAYSYARHYLNEGDEILLTEMEHHSNIVPWQMVAAEKKLKVVFVPVTESGEIDLKKFESLLSAKTKMVSFVFCSNTLGTINPVGAMIKLVRQKTKAKVLLDAAQAMTILPVDVQKLDCDFLAFSGHKTFGPFGIGVLWGKKDLLNNMPPFLGGGSMIDQVSTQGTTFLQSPHRFEAGTPNVTGAYALGLAIDYIHKLGQPAIFEHEQALMKFANDRVFKISGIKPIGTAKDRVNILSFVLEGAHHSDVSQILDQQGVAVRAGHHCTQPLMKRFGIQGTVRASFSVYNNESDVEALVSGLQKAKEMLL